MNLLKACLTFHGLQFHLVGESSLAGEQSLSLEVAVHHDNSGCVVVHRADNDGHSILFGQFTGSSTAAGTRTPDCRMLSAISIIAPSSLTLKGWFLKGRGNSDKGISLTCSEPGASLALLGNHILFLGIKKTGIHF